MSLTINLNGIFCVKEHKYACKNWSMDPDFSRHGYSFSKHVRASRHVFRLWVSPGPMWRIDNIWHEPKLLGTAQPFAVSAAAICHSVQINGNVVYYVFIAFSAMTLLVGCQEEHPACKNWLMRCWCGYLSGSRCGLFAYGPADATAILKPYCLLPHLIPDWFYHYGTGLTRLSWKRGR